MRIMRRIKIAGAVAILLLISLLSLPVNSQTTGTIEGIVRDVYTNEPIQNALIEVYPAGADPNISVPVAAVYADDGSFSITIEKGLYDVYASRIGYHTGVKRNIGLIPDQTVYLTFKLYLTDEIINTAIQNGIQYLANNQDIDGGLEGNTAGYRIQATAWMVIALTDYYGLNYTEMVDKAISWLVQMQNWDGSWGGSDDDRVKLTSLVIWALRKAGIDISNETIQKGVSWLKSRYNKGSYGSIIGTASAVIGLLAAGENPQNLTIKNAITWLLTQQKDDGSWEESLQTTFFVIKAIKEAGAISSKVDKAIQWIKSQQKSRNGWWGNCINTAFALLSLEEMATDMNKINAGISWLVWWKKGWIENIDGWWGWCFENDCDGWHLTTEKAYEGTKSWKWNGGSLILPPIDLTLCESSSIDYMFCQYYHYHENHHLIEVSFDKVGWSEINRKGGDYVSWSSTHLSLSSYVGKQLYIRFRAVGMYWLFIDDVEVSFDGKSENMLLVSVLSKSLLPLIMIEKSSDKDEVKLGDTLTMTLTIRNAGRVSTHVSVIDDIPYGFELLNGSNIWNGTLEGGESYTISYTLLANQSGVFVFDSAIATYSDNKGREYTVKSNSFSVEVKTNKPPIPSFAWHPENPVAGDVITFDASNSTDVDGTIVKYEWDWNNDGIFDETKYGSTATHSWNKKGTYIVTLKVTDNEGAENTTSKSIAIANAPPRADFVWSPANPKINQTVVFDASSSSDFDGSIVSYEWDWDNDGTYDETKYSPATTHLWNVEGEHEITLRVTDDEGAKNTTTKRIVIKSNTLPVASFKYTPAYPFAGDIITFDASDSFDPDGYIVLYEWDWNSDGVYDETSYSSKITHSWYQKGNYSVTLRVTDDDGAKNITTKNIVINNVPPSADFTWHPLDAEIKAVITFDASNSTDADGEIVSYEWDWDNDGTYDDATADPTITHSWNEGGEYFITLRVLDNDGASATVTKLIVVRENRRPVAKFSWTPLTPNVGELVTFDASSSYDPDGYIESYIWEFGDGSIGYGKVVSYVYKNGGTFTVNLTVIDNGGLKKSSLNTIYIIPGSEPTEPKNEPFVHVYGTKTNATVGEDIILTLSAVNPITSPTMTVQLILKIPSGMEITSSEFAESGAGQYTGTFTIEPGKSRYIGFNIKTSQAGEYDIEGNIFYYFGNDKSTAKYKSQILHVTVNSPPEPSKHKDKTPGFEMAVIITAFVFVILLVNKKRR